MLETNFIPARSLQKSYKAIIEKVKSKKVPVVLTKNNKPQAAIVTLEDLQNLKKIRAQKSTQALLKLADLANKYHTKGPATNAVKDTKEVWDYI